MRKERGPAGLIQGGENAVVQVRQRIWKTADTTSVKHGDGRREPFALPTAYPRGAEEGCGVAIIPRLPLLPGVQRDWLHSPYLSLCVSARERADLNRVF